MKLFQESTLKGKLDDVLVKLDADIKRITDTKLLTIDLDKYSAEFATSYILRTLDIEFAKRTSTVELRDTPVHDVFSPRGSGRASLAHAIYKFPVSGDIDLLLFRPSKKNLTTRVNYTTVGNSLHITYRTTWTTEELSPEIKKEVIDYMQPLVENMKEVLEALKQEINDFNQSLPAEVLQKLKVAKEAALKRKKRDDDLNNF
jgi:hypothetical protein